MSNNIIDSLDMGKLGNELKRARKQRGLTQEDAAHFINVARTTITAIENGERKIRADELVELVRAYGRSLSDFVSPRPIIESFKTVQFRGPPTQTAHNQDQTDISISRFEDLCRNYLDLEQSLEKIRARDDLPEYERHGSNLELEAEWLAQHERKRLGLGDGPLPAIRDILEQDYKIRVFYLSLKPSNLSGIYYYSSELGGCIAVNTDHPEERCRWTMSHDLAHYLSDRHEPTFHYIRGYQRQPESERFAEFFAKYFLLPTSSLTQQFRDNASGPQSISIRSLFILANRFGTSIEAMTLRLEDLRLLKVGAWDRLKDSGLKVREIQDELKLDPIPGRRDTFPIRYRQYAFEAFENGKISEEKFSNYLELDRLEARKLIAEFMGGQDKHSIDLDSKIVDVVE